MVGSGHTNLDSIFRSAGAAEALVEPAPYKHREYGVGRNSLDDKGDTRDRALSGSALCCGN